MTLLYTQGFEGYDVGGGITALQKDFMHNINTAGAEAGLIAGRNGYGIAAFAADNQNSFTGLWGHYIPTAGLSSEDDWIVGLAFYSNNSEFINSGGSRAPVIQFADSDGLAILTVYVASGTLNVRIGNSLTSGTKLGFANVLMTTKVWHYIECKVKFDTAAGGSVVLHVDEEEVMNVSSVVTSTSDIRPSMICVGGGTQNNNFRVDDIYICDDLGTVNNTFLGDVRIEKLTPTSNGTTSDFVGSDADSTDNYLLVDDVITVTGTATGGGTSTLVDTALTEADDFWNGKLLKLHDISTDEDFEVTVTAFVASSDTITFTPALSNAVVSGDTYSLGYLGSDDDTTYVESKVAGIKDTYAFTNSATTTPAEIVAVSVKSNVRKSDAGSRTFVHVAKNGTTTNELDSASLYPSVTYRYMESIFELDPNDGVTPITWTRTEVDAAEFGYKVAT